MTTQTLTLTGFLLARIAEDEAVALAGISATGESPWQASSYRVVVDDGFEVADASVPSAAHIARHDPIRVLAECAGKRAIVALHADAHDCAQYVDPEDNRDCGTLRAIGRIYADHPDYRSEWAL